MPVTLVDGSNAVGRANNMPLKLTTGTVTIFACDYKSRNAGSIISSDLVKGATGPGGYLDLECGDNVAGYESSNDLNIGRTAVSFAKSNPKTKHAQHSLMLSSLATTTVKL